MNYTQPFLIALFLHVYQCSCLLSTGPTAHSTYNKCFQAAVPEASALPAEGWREQRVHLTSFPQLSHTFPLFVSGLTEWVILWSQCMHCRAETYETLCLMLMAAAILTSPKWETRLRALLIVLHSTPPSIPTKFTAPPFPYVQRTRCGRGISQSRLQEVISACESPIFLYSPFVF